MRRSEAPERSPGSSLVPLSDSVQRAAFVAAIGLSAFLLFTLELRAGRLVLPVFGGAPAVWTTGLCFFTSVLFLGYVYAHLIATRISFRVAGAVQLALAISVVVAAIVAPTHLASLRVDGLPQAINVLVVLAVIAGAPAFLLATTTPLLSSWYSARGHDPWWLFAVSNGASFLALLAYPLLIAPNIGLSAQRIVLVAGLTAYVAFLVPIVLSARQSSVPQAAAPSEPTTALTSRRQAVWLFAALVPAGLLSATTNFLQTDLISAPLIWIGPLAVYLASFVVAFADRGRSIVRACVWLVPVGSTLLWLPFIKPAGWPPLPLFLVELGAFFILAVAIHGRLAADRPESSQLTRFYLIVTAGGALGTAFVSLVAPQIFNNIYEYPLLIVFGHFALVLLPAAKADATARDHSDSVQRALLAQYGRLVPYAAAGLLLYLLIDAEQSGLATDVRNLLLVGAVVIVVGFTPRTVAVAAPIALIVLIAATWTSPLVRERTFFGVIEVSQSGDAHIQTSGTTLHGLQYLDEARRKEPTTYYSRFGPVGDVFDDLRSRTDGARIGVVGLGVGTIAAYAQPDDEMTFYEINSAVVDIARDPKYFTYLADASVTPDVVVGDARLSLEDQAPASFDLLVLDAFSSDTVPAHLLTREAIETYTRTLRPGGVLAFHLSNRYYDLAAPVAATSRDLGLDTLLRMSIVDGIEQDVGATDSLWLVATDDGDIKALAAAGWTATPDGGYVLTDDYSDLTRSLNLGGF
jgi:SAM-dependent methyltransferase